MMETSAQPLQAQRARFRQVTQARFDYFVPNYLIRHLPQAGRICSAGCGTAYDVELLCRQGYDAWGFDRGANTLLWDERPADVRARLRLAYAEEMPFEPETFDFVYALEVIEHVGCEDGQWKLLPEAAAVRKAFFESCLDLLKPGGRLLVSTSNRLCLYDLGHGHHYHWLTNWLVEKFKLRLTIPWHPQNFVWSEGDVRRLLQGSRYKDRFRITRPSVAGYLSFSKTRQGGLRRLANQYLNLIDRPALRTSFLNPLLVLIIEKT